MSRVESGEGLEAALARLKVRGYEVGESERHHYVKVYRHLPFELLYREVRRITAGCGIEFRLLGGAEHGDWTAIRLSVR